MHYCHDQFLIFRQKKLLFTNQMCKYIQSKNKSEIWLFLSYPLWCLMSAVKWHLQFSFSYDFHIVQYQNTRVEESLSLLYSPYSRNTRTTKAAQPGQTPSHRTKELARAGVNPDAQFLFLPFFSHFNFNVRIKSHSSEIKVSVLKLKSDLRTWW